MFQRLYRRRAAAAHRRAEEHRLRRLRLATDTAITAAVRAQLAEPVTDLHVDPALLVTVGDVLARARADALDVRPAEAAAMLRHRLAARGLAGWPDILTDAYDAPEHRGETA